MAKLLRILLVTLALSLTTASMATTVTIAAPCEPGELGCN